MEGLRSYLEGRSQKDFAARAKITEAYLSQLASGKRRPSFAVMERIEAASEGAITIDMWRTGRAAA